MSPILLGILSAQAAGAGGAAYDLLETQVLSTNPATFTFSGLGSYTNYRHLQIRATVRTTVADTGAEDLYFTVNGVTTSDYTTHAIRRQTSNVVTEARDNDTSARIERTAVSDNEAAGIYGAFVMDILDPFNTNKNTTFRTLSGLHCSEAANTVVALWSNLFKDTSALSSITFDPAVGNLKAGTRFSLYGVK